MTFLRPAGIAIAVCALGVTPAGLAHAQSLSVTKAANYLGSYGVNPIGVGSAIGSTGYYTGGTYDSVVAFVTPNPVSTPSSSQTVVTATQGAATYNIPYLGGGAFPDQYYRNLPYSAALNGAWSLTVSNPTTTPTSTVVSTPTLAVTTPPTAVQGINLTGSDLAPTISWTVPAGSTATAETVYIFPVTPGTPAASLYASATLAAGTTSFTIPTGLLTAGKEYSISVQSDVYSGGGTTGHLQARTREFSAPFVATATTSTAAIYLPTVSSSTSTAGAPIYQFSVPNVVAAAPVVIDPTVAVGYIYQTGASDPNFASVALPNIGNSAPYKLYLWNGSSFVFDTSLAANQVFDFASGGVSEFEVLGIDPSLALDPLNQNNFATTLTFVSSGSFTGTMTPVTQDVPEPASAALFATAAALLLRRRTAGRH